MNKDLEGVSDSKYGLSASEMKGVGDYVKSTKNADNKSCLDEVPVRGSSTLKQPGKPPKKATYGKDASAKKTQPLSKFTADQTDKIFELERENTSLKSKENILETEITKMKTKLRRIEELMKKKRSTQPGVNSMLPADVQRQLQDEIDKMNQENEVMRARNNKLKAIEKELSMKHIQKKAPQNKYAHVKGKLPNMRVKQSEQDFQRLMEELKVQLVQGEKEIIKLTTHRDQIQQKFSNTGQNEIANAIDSYQKELNDIQRKIGEIKIFLSRDESMFDESKSYIEKKQQEIQDLTRECESLQHKNFQINVRAQQAKELSEDLDNIRADRDSIEKSITQITQYPFMKNQSGQQTTQQRAAQLELRLQELTRQAQKAKAEEELKKNEVDEIKLKINQLKGANEEIKKQHKEAKNQFVEKNGKLQEGDVYRDLFNRDKDAYARAVSDMATRPESDPIWKDYQFLERSNDTKETQDEKALRAEIERIKHENKDFAAELDKAQSLLKLQTDIERENRQYYQQEKERLKILAQSNELKANEIAKRIDGQAKIIMDMKKALGLESTTVRPGAAQSTMQHMENISTEFVEDDADLTSSDENILDVKVMDGILNDAIIEDFLRKNNSKKVGELQTMVSIDFYNHETRATQLASGNRPQYDSQISFKNKMDYAYMKYLNGSKIKLEVYLAVPGKQPHRIGTCETLLIELVERSAFGSVVSKTLNIVPEPGITGTLAKHASPSIGSLAIKMRLRRPIQEAQRYQRDMNEIKDATMKTQNASGLASTQKLVTIQVIKCKNLTTASGGEMQKIAPYFTYQFYTFDERYSRTEAGQNPVFQDTQQYTLNLDEQAITFLDQHQLEIVFIDDNAPITGIERGGQGSGEGVDDMIGICKVPLADIVRGVQIDGEFDIRAASGEPRGQAHVKISTVSSGGDNQGKLSDQKMSYSTQWENDIINRIAAKLGKLSLEVELMFGIFSRGTKACTHEDFKYCCLQRLNLKSEISEKELDMFLSGNSKLKGKNLVEQKDFVEIFSNAIIKARNNTMNQEALDRTLMMRYNDMVSQSGNLDQSSPMKAGTISLGDFLRKDAIGVLVQCILNSTFDELNKQVSGITLKGQFKAEQLRKILKQHGQASDFDSEKVTNLISANGTIFKEKFDQLIEEALIDARFSSLAVSKFNKMIRQMPEQISEMFLTKDINKDGNLSLDGFKTAVLSASEIQDYKLTTEELNEIFNLLSTKGEFLYAEYIIEQDAANRVYFHKVKNLSSVEDSMAQSSVQFERSHSKVGDVPQSNIPTQQPTAQTPKQATPKQSNALMVGKQKIEQYMVTQDVTLSMIFNVVDSNSDNFLTKAEFKQQMRGLHMGLEEEELEAIFNHLDTNNDQKIDYQEFIKQFTAINTSQIIKRMRRILYGASISAETIYNKNCAGRELMRNEFKNILVSLIQNIADFEVDSIFNELDKDRVGYIPKERFLDWFGYDEQEKQFQTGIEDIIKPLSTYMQRKGQTETDLFSKFDQNRNQMLSSQELATAVKALLQFEMSQEEIKTMHEFFRAKFRRSEVRKSEFAELMRKKTIRKYNTQSAKTALASIKTQLKKTGDRDITSILQKAVGRYPGEVTIRNFKLYVYSIGCLTQQQVNNLARYMDRNNDGMIKISDMEMAINTDKYSPVAGVMGNKK